MKVGLDVGSTTIKCVVLNDEDKIIYSTYERHFSHILEKSQELLQRVAEEQLPGGLGAVTTAVLVSHVVEAAKKAAERK